MSDMDGEVVPHVEGQNDDGGERPVIELFVKAALDKMKNGSCPTCHRYFLLFYILLEEGLIDLVVTTCLPQDPPAEVKAFTSGKHYPVIIVHKGVDSKGTDISGMEIDNMDELEQLVGRFDCERTQSRNQSILESDAEKSFEDLYKTFNLFLMKKSDEPTPVLRCLARVNQHLKDMDTHFMVMDKMARADCFFIPILQHIRVAGNYYKGFEIPTELTYLWKYLSNVYNTKAFSESCPSDREIIMHYEKKAVRTTPTTIKISLMKDKRTESVPSSADLNGANDSEEEEEEDYNSAPHAQVSSDGTLDFGGSSNQDHYENGEEATVNDG